MDSTCRILKCIICTCLLILQFVAILMIGLLWRKQAITPYDDPCSRWESKIPHIILSVGSPGNRENSAAYMEIDGKLVQIDFNISSITVRTDIYAHNDNTQKNVLLKADCRYYKDKIVLKVLEDNVFNGKYKKIVLYRTTESEPALTWPANNDLNLMYIYAAVNCALGAVLLTFCRAKWANMQMQKVLQVFATMYEAIAVYIVLMCIAGDNLIAIYVCAAVCVICGIMLSLPIKKRCSNVHFANALRTFAIALIVGALIAAVIAPFPEFYRVRLQ